MEPDRVRNRQVFLGGVQFTVTPTPNSSAANEGATELDVNNIDFLVLSSTAPALVTNISGGVDGFPVRFLGDGFTTFQDNAIIHTNTAANKLLIANIVYTYTSFDSQWYENE